MSQTIAGHPDTFTFAATYYLNGAAKTQTYPSGRTVSYGVDDAGRVTTVAAGTRTYADMTATVGHAYAPDGRLQQMKLGNNLWETRDYRTPGTTTRFLLGTSKGTAMSPGASEHVALGYNYSGTANNGNLMSHTITRPGRTQPWTQEFTYDAANRLETAGETGGYDREFGYDRYGNRWVATNTGRTAGESHEPQSNVFAAATNRMTTSTVAYDAAGNQTLYSPHTLAYDAENRLKSMTHASSGSGTYLYDGEGWRVKKTWTPGGGTAADTYYVYDIAGNLAAEYGTASNSNPSPPATLYPFTDMLGSVRAVTDANGAVIECYDYLPFGRMLSSSDNGRSASCHPSSPDTALDSKTSQKFTGQIRDAESRLDYFGARYMSVPQGRFLSPDPLMASASVRSPQSWNRYTYVNNNPIKYVDPTGAYICEGTDEECEDFENALDSLRGSEDAETSRSATSFGSLGDQNGVVVSFDPTLRTPAKAQLDPMQPLETDPNREGRLRARVKVTVRTRNNGDPTLVAHEGSHVADYQVLVGSLDFVGGGNPALNITQRQSEVRAYQLSLRLRNLAGMSNTYSCGVVECDFSRPMPPALRDQMINILIDDPRNGVDNPASPLYPEFERFLVPGQ